MMPIFDFQAIERIPVPRRPTLNAVAEIANGLRARGLTPLMPGRPRETVDPLLGVGETARSRGWGKLGRSLVARTPDFRFYGSPVVEMLNDVYEAGPIAPSRLAELVVIAPTKWVGGAAYGVGFVHWVPEWVAVAGHAMRIAEPAVVAMLNVFRLVGDGYTPAALRRLLLVVLLENPELREPFVGDFWNAVAELRESLSAAEKLGGAEAVEAILREIGQ